MIYLLSTAGPIHLDPDRYFNFWPEYEAKLADACVVHFLGTKRFYKHLYTKLAARVASELCAVAV